MRDAAPLHFAALMAVSHYMPRFDMAMRRVDDFRVRVEELLSYNPETGIFTWRKDRRAVAKKGDVAGSLDHGYIRIKLGGRKCNAHRLAWLMVTGSMPAGVVDHINGDRSDNRFCNLRDTTPKVNAQNRRSASKDKQFTDVIGPSFQTGRRKWLVNVKVDGKSRFVGRFDNLADANEAYVKAKRDFHPGYAA